ncbi:hypothetical protein AeMF1_017412 [Aphanomyces euteiches]|nr:hypothetical protein AeMF1_017412 [Aphanomyces euteiches]
MGLATNGGNGGYNTFSPVNGIADKSPRQQASWISRLFLLWVNPILRLGNQKQLALQDMWQFDDETMCAGSCAQLDHHWKASGSLLIAFVRSNGLLYAGVGFLLACAYGCDLLGP